GLVQAYKTATTEALDQAMIIEKIIIRSLHLEFDYVHLNEVMKVVKDYELEITSQHFDNTCTMQVEVRKKWEAEVKEKLKEFMSE
ncbi:MAG: YigZ family protein, partial [Bacteroidota bacterium]